MLPPVPRVALRLAIGEFADVGVVAGPRVLPRVLQQTGYRFRHETVEQALRWATGGAPEAPGSVTGAQADLTEAEWTSWRPRAASGRTGGPG